MMILLNMTERLEDNINIFQIGITYIINKEIKIKG
ncbi:conserved hypothetical protein [Xenorhabdus bovienii str. oregonense]|uniref:Uncharacterized protein n=1 Tax=Xenorhabdus bovienii str. oregonense TaxID=1398202 RepID=A0A077P8C1_XENBV|nr:conserved hypothetical protein [Xenorhabdus bovienii str. oregonense]